MKVLENFDLSALNTFHISCRSRYFSSITSVGEALELLDRFSGKKVMILGGGSNVVFTRDFDGLVIHNQTTGIEVVKVDGDDVRIKVASGEIWHNLVRFCVASNFGGIENLSLIPGTAGAAPIQNIGAYGVELKDVFEELEAVHLYDKYCRKFSLQACKFGYRDSVFKQEFRNQLMITHIVIRLKKNKKPDISYSSLKNYLERAGISEPSIQSVSEAVIAIRRQKLPDPDELGNAGSFFKNPVVTASRFKSLQKQYPSIAFYPQGDDFKIPAAWLIDYCGLKGYRTGNVGCHVNQPLVIVNYGSASGKEVSQFSQMVIDRVAETFGITLQREVNIV